MRRAPPRSHYEDGPDGVRVVYVDRSGTIALRASPLVNLVNGGVNGVLGQPIGGQHQPAFLQAAIVAESSARLLFSAKQNEGFAVVATRHRDFSVEIPEVRTRSPGIMPLPTRFRKCCPQLCQRLLVCGLLPLLTIGIVKQFRKTARAATVDGGAPGMSASEFD